MKRPNYRAPLRRDCVIAFFAGVLIKAAFVFVAWLGHSHLRCSCRSCARIRRRRRRAERYARKQLGRRLPRARSL